MPLGYRGKLELLTPFHAGHGRAPVVVLRIQPERAILPEDCACCGATASRTFEERRWLDGTGVLVPYCAECHRHASAEATAHLAVFWSTVLLGATAAVAVPLLLGPPGRLTTSLLVLAASALPSLVSIAWRRPTRQGHATTGRAVTFRSGALVCRNADWGERAARSSDVPFERRAAWDRSIPLRAALASAVAAGAAGLLVEVLFPVVHVVTSGAEPLRVFVDGRERGVVRPSGSEYPASLERFRVVIGPREFLARTMDGQERDRVRFDVSSGRDYLYAPDSRGTCFTVESARYGRGGTAPSAEPLDPAAAFWEIAPRIDVWMAPLPEASPDRRSSGGPLRALRRAPCPDRALPGDAAF